MARFYGFQPSEISRMNLDEFEEYFVNIDRISASEKLSRFQDADWPIMKGDARDGLHKKIHKIANPDEKKKVISFDDLERVLNG